MGRRFLLLSLTAAMAGAALRGYQNGTVPKLYTPGTAQSATTGPYSLRGIVVNGATGEPVPRALVRLNTTAPKVALSGPDGRFEFDELPEASAIVIAQKPGFYTPQEIGQTRPYPLIQIGKDAADIKVNLYPCATITGRVTNTTGDPLQNVQIRALYRRVINGESRLEERGSGFTDDSGVYQIANLVPGKYYLATVSRSARILSPNVRPFNTSFDLVYPALYYPNSPDRSGATTVDALPGQQAEADFTENIAKAYSVSGSIAGGPRRPVLFLSDRDGNRVMGRIERKDDTFRIHDLPPGEYSVVAESMRVRDRNEALYGTTPVVVNNSDVDGVSVELSPAATIPVQVDWDKPPSDNTQAAVTTNAGVHLTPEVRRLGNDEYWSRTDTRDGQTVELIERVLPGSYRVTVRSNPRGYLASLRSGQTDLMQNRLVVTPGAAPGPIEVVFRGGAATLNGTVKGGTGVSSWVVIVPDSDTPVEYNPVSVGGQFTISGLAPGAYHVFALTSVDGLEYRNRDVMRQFENQSTSVSLSENETKQIELTLIGGSGT